MKEADRPYSADGAKVNVVNPMLSACIGPRGPVQHADIAHSPGEDTMNRRHILTGLFGTVILAPLAARAESRTPRQLAEAFAATLSAHDMDRFAALFADDYV